MALNKVIAAKVVAYGDGWVDPEGFARCAERGTIYVQAHYLVPNTPVSFFAIGRGDEKVVLERLEELNLACGLGLALPYDAVSHEMLSLLSTIERRWEEKHTHPKDNNPLEGVYELSVVADIGMDVKTKETKYICFPYFVESIHKAILEELQTNGSEAGLDIQSLTDSTMQTALKQHFVRLYGRANKGWTMKEIEEFAEAKRWMPREKS